MTSSRELGAAYPRYELELDDEEDEAPLTDNVFWQRRICAHNATNRAMRERGAGAVSGTAEHVGESVAGDAS